MAKKLVINCAACDMRKALEENYAEYESITLNAATVLTNAAGKAFLNKIPVTMNCADVVDIEDEADVRVINGHSEIKSDDRIPEKKFVILVNGSLTIGPDTEKYLEQCVSIRVNGSVLYPNSMAAFLGNMQVNGSSSCYPDGAIILKRNAVIDRLFVLRAKKNLYWSPKRVILVDPQLDTEKLKEKGVSFSAPEVILSASKAEELIDLIDEKAEIIIVPDGTAVISDDVTLDEAVLRRYGNQLYVIGDVTVPADRDCLDELRYLVVRGDAEVPESRKEKLLEVMTSFDGELTITKPHGLSLHDKPYLKLTKWLLEQHPNGIDVRDCAVVKLDADIPKEWIMKRLHMTDCGIVRCSEEQEDAVSLICEDVGKIATKEEEEAGGMMQDILAGISGAKDTKVINAAEYVM